MENRRDDKIIEVEDFLEKFESILPNSFDEYVEDFVKKAACERYFERIVEAVVDLAFLVIKERGFKTPDYTRESFEILAEKGLVSKELSAKLGNAKSMRNWLAHRYGKVDDLKVFNAIKNELVCDVEEFLEAVK